MFRVARACLLWIDGGNGVPAVVDQEDVQCVSPCQEPIKMQKSCLPRSLDLVSAGDAEVPSLRLQKSPLD